MGLEDADRLDDGGKAALSISCSICLEDVTDYGDRAWAKLQCGHQFHLDCIGSAFNVKGVMQCPNCRKVEKGQWLYADSCRPYLELNIDDLVNDEDVYDQIYPESSMWCPFGGFSRLAAVAAFDEVEFPSTGYNEIVGQHSVFSEEHSATASSHICPYIAYVQPSTSSANVGRYNNSRWNNNNSQSEIPNSYNLPTMDLHYNTHPTRTNIDMPTSGSFVHPFLAGQSSFTRGPSSISGARTHEAYSQQRITHRSNTQVHVGSSSNQTHGVYHPSSARSFHDAENSMLNPFYHILERDPPHPYPYPCPYPYPYPYPYAYLHERGPFHQPGGVSARHRRIPSHSQYLS